MAKSAKSGASDVDIGEFLNSRGFDTQQARMEARALLESEGLTHSKKKRMAATKLERAGQVLERFTRVCRDDVCRRLTQDAERPVEVSPKSCSVCGGSEARRWCRYLSAVLGDAGITKCLVVGGTKVYWDEMKQHLENPQKHWRFVDGTKAAPKSENAKSNLRWCDLCIIWAPSPLNHKVSNQYKDAQQKVVVTGRSIQSLCRAVIKYCDRAGVYVKARRGVEA